MKAAPAAPRPRALLLAVSFFAVSAVLEVVLAFVDAPRPTLVALWEALGRAVLPALLAAGLWRGFSLCRTMALVYAIAALVTYLVVLAMAVGGAPVRFPPSVIVQSLVQVPSCALLVPWLRSPAAAGVLRRRLLGD
jgi:hypothetical protein